MHPPFILGDDLALKFSGVTIQLSPRDGLLLAEDLTRKSFRNILIDEAARHPAPTAKAKRKAGR
jgi:hypothetical protein